MKINLDDDDDQNLEDTDELKSSSKRSDRWYRKATHENLTRELINLLEQFELNFVINNFIVQVLDNSLVFNRGQTWNESMKHFCQI